MAEQEKPKGRLDTLEEVVFELADAVKALKDQMEKLEKSSIKKSSGLFGGKREKTAIKDTKTGKVYVSKSAVGKVLAAEADTTAEDHFAWYKLQAKFPDRFVDASAEEKAKADTIEKAKLAREIEEANKKLQAEQAKSK